MAEQLIVFRSGPRGSEAALELAEALITLAAFGQPCRVLFIGDGVLQLTPGSNGNDGRSLESLLAPLPEFGIPVCYAQASAVKKHTLAEENLLVPVKLLADDEIADIMRHCRHAIGW